MHVNRIMLGYYLYTKYLSKEYKIKKAHSYTSCLGHYNANNQFCTIAVSKVYVVNSD